MPEILGKDLRTVHFTREAVNEDGTIDISFSSETDQVERWFGIEVLSHEPGAMDMSRAADGLPFLMEHCSQLIGRVINIHIGDDRKGRGTVRFSSNPEAQQIRQDMIDGIRPDISVGYWRLEQVTQAGEGNASDVVTVTRWMPFEISTVCVPSDTSVGVGRSAQSETPAAPAAISEEARMSVPESTVAATPAAITVNVEEIRSEAAKQSGERAAQILALADRFQVPADKRNAWISGGASVDAVREQILSGLETAKPATAPSHDIDPESREMKEYSLLRALRSLTDGENSPELEISKTIAKRMGRGTDGFFMPTNLPMGQRAGLDSTTTNKGAELKFTAPGSFIDMLRNKALLLKMGATFLPGLTSNVAFPRQTGAGSAAWLASENPGSDAADSNLTLDQVTLSPKTLVTSSSYSRQLLIQSSFPIEQKVRADIAAVIALAVDLAGIQGTGLTGQPKGILNTSGIGSVAMGTNGAALTNVTPLVDLESKIFTANADADDMGYLTTPGQRGAMKKTLAFATAGASAIWTDNGGGMGLVNGYKAAATNQMPSTLTKGTASGICHAAIFGVWSELLIGEWGALEILVDPYRLKKQGMIEITGIYMADIQVRHAASFAAIADLL